MGYKREDFTLLMLNGSGLLPLWCAMHYSKKILTYTTPSESFFHDNANKRLSQCFINLILQQAYEIKPWVKLILLKSYISLSQQIRNELLNKNSSVKPFYFLFCMSKNNVEINRTMLILVYGNKQVHICSKNGFYHKTQRAF